MGFSNYEILDGLSFDKIITSNLGPYQNDWPPQNFQIGYGKWEDEQFNVLRRGVLDFLHRFHGGYFAARGGIGRARLCGDNFAGSVVTITQVLYGDRNNRDVPDGTGISGLAADWGSVDCGDKPGPVRHHHLDHRLPLLEKIIQLLVVEKYQPNPQFLPAYNRPALFFAD